MGLSSVELHPKRSTLPGRVQDLPVEVIETAPGTPPKLAILIVDDAEAVRMVLGTAFRQSGFMVWLAADGREALELYRFHSKDIDLVLLDVRMVGLNGPRTLAALQALNPEIRCCFMSGDLGGYTEKELLELGASRVFKKPFGVAGVIQAVRELAGGPKCKHGVPSDTPRKEWQSC